VLKPFKQSVYYQAQHAVATLHRNQMRLPCDNPIPANLIVSVGNSAITGFATIWRRKILQADFWS
jgi:hypothetical protein